MSTSRGRALGFLARRLRDSEGAYDHLGREADDDVHPVDAVIRVHPEVSRVERAARELSRRLSLLVPDRALWVEYEDLRTLQRSTNERLYFDAGYHVGVITGAGDSLGRGRRQPRSRSRSGAEARALARGVSKLVLTAPLAPPVAAAALIEALYGLVRAQGSGTSRGRGRRA